jgi:GNAT superfamily N-acetyltransferase
MTDILNIDESAAEEDELLETLNWQVEDLFDQCHIRIASYEEPLYGIADGDELIAALVSGSPDNDPWCCNRFSLVVHPDHRRQGLGQKLVEAFLAYCEADGFQAEAHVVNDEAMNPMLEGLGFTAHGPLWTY